MASQPETPDREYMRQVKEKRATSKHLGIELMVRWNQVELAHPLFHELELAVLGHEDEDDYTFLIEVNGKIFHVTIAEEK